VALIPQPFRVQVISPPQPTQPPPGPPAPDWTGASKQLRDVSQWIIGGVVATAAGVFAGSTLTKLGQLSFSDDPERLWLAIVGGLLGFAAIAAILMRGLEVLAPDGCSLAALAKAPPGSTLEQARDHLFEIVDIDQVENPLGALLAQTETEAAQEYLPDLFAAGPFCVVRIRFNRLLDRMTFCVPLAILGFGLFAWAANPPEKHAPPEKGFSIKFTQ